MHSARPCASRFTPPVTAGLCSGGAPVSFCLELEGADGDVAVNLPVSVLYAATCTTLRCAPRSGKILGIWSKSFHTLLFLPSLLKKNCRPSDMVPLPFRTNLYTSSCTRRSKWRISSIVGTRYCAGGVVRTASMYTAVYASRTDFSQTPAISKATALNVMMSSKASSPAPSPVNASVLLSSTPSSLPSITLPVAAFTKMKPGFGFTPCWRAISSCSFEKNSSHCT